MLLTDEEIAVRFQDLQALRIELDEDPVSVGLTSLTAKLAQIQLNRDRVQFLLNEAIRNSTEAEVVFKQAESLYDGQMDFLLSTDEDVKSRKSEAMRSAQARTKMSEQVLKLHHAELDMKKAQAYFKGLYSILENMESANNNISRQITVIQMSTAIGEVPGKHFSGGTVVKLKH